MKKNCINFIACLQCVRLLYPLIFLLYINNIHIKHSSQ